MSEETREENVYRADNAEPANGVPVEWFLKVSSVLNGNVRLTPYLFSELLKIAARLEEIEREGLE